MKCKQHERAGGTCQAPAPPPPGPDGDARVLLAAILAAELADGLARSLERQGATSPEDRAGNRALLAVALLPIVRDWLGSHWFPGPRSGFRAPCPPDG